MGMIQYTHYEDKGKDTLGLTTFVQFTENSGTYRCNSVDCFMRANDVSLFKDATEADKFCKKVATGIKKLYDASQEELISDVNFYGMI